MVLPWITKRPRGIRSKECVAISSMLHRNDLWSCELLGVDTTRNGPPKGFNTDGKCKHCFNTDHRNCLRGHRSPIQRCLHSAVFEQLQHERCLAHSLVYNTARAAQSRTNEGVSKGQVLPPRSIARDCVTVTVSLCSKHFMGL